MLSNCVVHSLFISLKNTHRQTTHTVKHTIHIKLDSTNVFSQYARRVIQQKKRDQQLWCFLKYVNETKNMNLTQNIQLHTIRWMFSAKRKLF